jgi:serine/threonine protein kinase
MSGRLESSIGVAGLENTSAQFAQTHWTLVLAAAERQSPGGQEALEHLCRAYWYPLYAFLRKSGRSPHDAQDLVQGFFAHLLAKESRLKSAHPAKGKFRTFLLACLKHYVANQRDKERAASRNPGQPILSIDESQAEERYRLEPADLTDPAKIFERRWAFTVVERALHQLKEVHAAEGKSMGTVWMAEQTEPIRRTVALKIIKAGMDSNQVLARFEAERQALALMDHPNISKVLDAGTTAEGRPYFVMELVKGVPIVKFCDERRLSIRERLDLFIPVCQALQHAHQKGIIHRDVKPSNVLVALYDGHPVPKVIDFGIAKAAGLRLTERTLFTELGALIGTPEYMSPEQAELNQLDIDTRSDIYSLGVLLYELLTGTTLRIVA